MSDYPVTPAYGAGYGSGDQNNTPYVPPYTNPYMQGDVAAQGHMGANYDASMSAYGYNQSVPVFPTPNLAAGIPPLPIYQGWHQETVPLPPYSTPHNPTPYQGYVQNTQVQQSAQYYPPVSQPSYQQNNASVQRYEHADLSDGEFEDAAATHTPIDYNGAQWGGGNGYSDSAQRSFHDKNQNSQSASHAGNNYASRSRDTSHMERQQSDSYSPYGADEQPQYKSTTLNELKLSGIGKTSTQNGFGQNGTTTSTDGNHTNGWHKEQDEATHAQTTVQTTASQPPTLKGKTVPEMRKEAGEAIRALFPLGVRYPTYMEEGFKEDIISNLFSDINIPKPAAAPIRADVAHPSSTARNSIPDNAKKEGNGTVDMNTPMVASGASLIPGTTAVPTRSVAMDEKQKTLQSKMEALRKSREERAQKAAAKNTVKTASAPIPPAPSTSTSAPSVLSPRKESPQPIDISTAESSKSPPASTHSHIAQPLSENKIIPIQALAQPVNKPQTPLIPGLFLASNTVGSTSAPAPTPPLASSAPIVNQRKRPVAADFDEPPMASFRRPFGHSRNEQPLVINVSEDESDDEDVAMDLDSQADQDSPVQPGRKMSDQRSTPLQAMQQNTFPVRKPYTPPPNLTGTNTPPRPQSASKAPLPTPDVLQQKESEIQKLKKMIAEREAARARARQTPSGSGAQTPRASEVEVVTSKDNLNMTNGTSTSKVETSIQVQKMITVADEKVALDQQRLVDAQAAEAKKAAEVAQKEAEQKRLRRQKIASDLPLVDAEVQKGQIRLEQMRAEMAKIEADMRQKLEDKRKLSEEMARLGQETDDQLQAQKNKLNDLNREEASKSAGPSHIPAPIPAAKPSHPSPGDQEVSLPLLEPNEVENIPADLFPNEEPGLPPNTLINSSNHVDGPSNALPSSAMDEERDDSKDSISTDRALEAQLQEAVRAQADRHGDGDNDTGIEIAAPKPNPARPELASSPPEEGQISDDYSPVLDRAMPDVHDRESDISEHESDDYEPPDATPPENVPEMNSPPFSPAPPNPVPELNGDDMVIDSIQAADTSGQKDDIKARHRDDGALLQVIENDIHQPTTTQSFVPYESPLKKFRAYRFHPEFKREVADGLRSLTYSHKIDPDIEFCRYELAGGVCNDETCVAQHFRSVKLADDAIMAAIGCPDEFKGEQRDRFRESLREVLMGLRVRKVKDFDTISSEIIAHRAKFLGDPSKILAALEGITL